MIARVTFEHTTFERLPFKFEAGTPDYVGTHGLAAAIDYVEAVGLDRIAAHEEVLTRHAMARMAEIDQMQFYGTVPGKTSVVSFNVGQIHPMDLGTLLDRLGFAIRTGHHCAQPLMARCGVEGMARVSFALYNTEDESIVSWRRCSAWCACSERPRWLPFGRVHSLFIEDSLGGHHRRVISAHVLPVGPSR